MSAYPPLADGRRAYEVTGENHRRELKSVVVYARNRRDAWFAAEDRGLGGYSQRSTSVLDDRRKRRG